jgi:hypothetical protein
MQTDGIGDSPATSNTIASRASAQRDAREVQVHHLIDDVPVGMNLFDLPWPGEDSNLRATDYEGGYWGPRTRGYWVSVGLGEVGWGHIWAFGTRMGT